MKKCWILIGFLLISSLKIEGSHVGVRQKDPNVNGQSFIYDDSRVSSSHCRRSRSWGRFSVGGQQSSPHNTSQLQRYSPLNAVQRVPVLPHKDQSSSVGQQSVNGSSQLTAASRRSLRAAFNEIRVSGCFAGQLVFPLSSMTTIEARTEIDGIVVCEKYRNQACGQTKIKNQLMEDLDAEKQAFYTNLRWATCGVAVAALCLMKERECMQLVGSFLKKVESWYGRQTAEYTYFAFYIALRIASVALMYFCHQSFSSYCTARKTAKSLIKLDLKENCWELVERCALVASAISSKESAH